MLSKPPMCGDLGCGHGNISASISSKILNTYFTASWERGKRQERVSYRKTLRGLFAPWPWTEHEVLSHFTIDNYSNLPSARACFAVFSHIFYPFGLISWWVMGISGGELVKVFSYRLKRPLKRGRQLRNDVLHGSILFASMAFICIHIIYIYIYVYV